jgi:hypothetical protein
MRTETPRIYMTANPPADARTNPNGDAAPEGLNLPDIQEAKG